MMQPKTPRPSLPSSAPIITLGGAVPAPAYPPPPPPQPPPAPLRASQASMDSVTRAAPPPPPVRSPTAASCPPPAKPAMIPDSDLVDDDEASAAFSRYALPLRRTLSRKTKLALVGGLAALAAVVALCFAVPALKRSSGHTQSARKSQQVALQKKGTPARASTPAKARTRPKLKTANQKLSATAKKAPVKKIVASTAAQHKKPGARGAKPAALQKKVAAAKTPTKINTKAKTPLKKPKTKAAPQLKSDDK